MKKLTYMTLLLTVTLSSCDNSSQQQEKNPVTSDKRTPGNFTHLHISSVCPVKLHNDSACAVVVKAHENDLKEIVTEVKNDTLFITHHNISAGKNDEVPSIHIYVKGLRSLSYRGVSSLVFTDTIATDSLQLQTETVGKVKVKVKADFMRANFKNVGTTTLTGHVREARINNKSVGELEADALKAAILMIHNTSIGKATVYADSLFYIRSEAVGALHYRGPGRVAELKTTGLGEVKKTD